MNELEQMLRADLRDVAGTVDIPISVDAVAAERDRLDTEERRARWGGRVLAAAVAAVLLTFAVWWVQTNVFRVPDTAVPNPLQTPVAPPPVDSVSPTPSPSGVSSAAASPSASPTPGSAAPTASGAPGARTVGTYVYFVPTDSFPNLVRELKQVSAETPARGALEAMLAGPSDPEAANLWNPATRILGIAKHGDVITVDLSREALDFNLGASYEGFMVDQLVWTVTEAFAPTDRVLITIEGREFATGHNVYDRPMGRGDGTQSAVRLLIDTPAHGATVSSPVRVTGLAAAFEGTILWEVRGPDPNSGVVAEGVAQTDEGMTLAPFAFDLPPLDPGTYEVRVTLDDPSGGEAGPPASETKVFTVA